MLLQPPKAGDQLVALALHEETVVLHGGTSGEVDLLWMVKRHVACQMMTSSTKAATREAADPKGNKGDLPRFEAKEYVRTTRGLCIP